MARAVNLEKLSYEQLQKLSEQVEAAKKDRKSEEAQAVRKKINDLLRQSGFTISEV